MSVDFSKNEFWTKKFYKELKVRDTNKDGYISKDDFDIIIQRYKDMGKTDKKHLANLNDCFNKILASVGIFDYSTKLTLDEAFERTAKNSSNFDDIAQDCASSQFAVIDSNCSGEISFQEWVEYYKAMDIDTQYARASFDAMDTDGDNIVSKEEFAAYMKEYYFSVEDKLNSSIMYGPLD